MYLKDKEKNIKINKIYILFIITVFIIVPIHSNDIIKMRKKSYRKEKISFIDSSVNPIIYYELYENNNLKSIIVISPSTAINLSFIDNKNKYDTNIYITDYSSVKNEISRFEVQEHILLVSSYYNLSKSQLIEKYFNKDGRLINYDFGPNILEFEYTILKNGLYLSYGCESSSELYIE